MKALKLIKVLTLVIVFALLFSLCIPAYANPSTLPPQASDVAKAHFGLILFSY